jgi:methylenetetrahydrofolate dehydrogenase (NADP+) / methenyltetrahydrofolate cyclohydrolase
MMANTLDGKLVAQKYHQLTREAVEELGFKPTLATILVGSREASKFYLGYIKKGADDVGINVINYQVNEPGLFLMIESLNKDNSTHAIFIAYPLNLQSIEDKLVMEKISPLKDAEGVHSQNIGYLDKYIRKHPLYGERCIVPCTAKAVVKMFEFYNIDAKGKFATIINDSHIVGRPLGLMLKNKGATVVNCHLNTPKDKIKELSEMADILITAVPNPDKSFAIAKVKDGAIVVDVSFEGNLDYEAISSQASWITPLGKGGVGPVTRAMIYLNTVYAAHYFKYSQKN